MTDYIVWACFIYLALGFLFASAVNLHSKCGSIFAMVLMIFWPVFFIAAIFYKVTKDI